MLISQTKLGGELLPERLNIPKLYQYIIYA